jgi:hypothetical protein
MIELPQSPYPYQPELPMELPHNLVAIEGGRAIAARDVQASFAVDTDDASTGMPNMAGYVIVAWCDEGGFEVHYHAGNRNPFSPAMIPDLVRGHVASSVLQSEDA